jgi:acetyl-CoA carboxylase carboxyl transferase subunit alpha
LTQSRCIIRDLEAEERGQGEAIARNIYEMMRLKVPVICVIIIGEGASGGALGIGAGDKVLYDGKYLVFSNLSRELFFYTYGEAWDKKEIAAEQLKLTAIDMKGFGLIDDIIPEPKGGAHWDYTAAAETVKEYILKTIQELQVIPAEERVNNRIEKYSKMGFWAEENV